MFKENPSTGYKLVVDTKALNGVLNVTSTYSTQNVTVDGVNMVGTNGMTLFTVTSVKEGSGVFRLHYANPGNYNSDWTTYDPREKWSYPIQVLSTISKGDAIAQMPPHPCFDKVCGAN